MRLPKFLLRRLGRPSGWFSGVFAWLFNRSNRDHNDGAVQALELEGDETVVDIGFGGGASFPSLLEALPEGRIIGIDPVEDMVKRAEKRWAEEVAAGRMEFRVGTAGETGLEDEVADAVLTVNTVYFWPDLDEGFAELARVLRPDGRLAVGFGQPQFLEGLGFGTVGHRVETPAYYRRAIASAGFEGVELVQLTRGRGDMVATARRRG